MSFPGSKHGSEHSFGEPKGNCPEHQVTVAPKKTEGNNTMANYANLLHEKRGESSKSIKSKD